MRDVALDAPLLLCALVVLFGALEYEGGAVGTIAPSWKYELRLQPRRVTSSVA